MKEERDFGYIWHINRHYHDLLDDIKGIRTLEEFSASDMKRRAVLFDLFQIGELANHLSPSFVHAFGEDDIDGVVGMRHHVVHGYSKLKDQTVFAAICDRLPSFIDRLNEFGRARYEVFVRSLLGKRVTVYVDRPIAFVHEGIAYPLNYGYIEDLTALDGEFQDAYVIDQDEPLSKTRGEVVAVVRRLNDLEDKLVVATNRKDWTAEEIEKKVAFVERFFPHELILKA
jgi:inorganic pyrophosphatase